MFFVRSPLHGEGEKTYSVSKTEHEQVKNKEGKKMSNTSELKPETKSARVEIGNLPQQEKELKEKEPESVKGGGGSPGGVIERYAGEEIPQRNQYAGEEIPQTTKR
jgi:hypothetical protein